MLTRLGYYADRLLEMGWLAAAVFIPLFFNVYSSRVFEPDKIALLRSIVLIMAVAWLIKLLEGGVRAASQSNAPTRAGKAQAALQGAAESGLPSWLGVFRVPMVVPILAYALAYLISTIFTKTPEATIFGSYQRMQGTYSQYSYMLLGIMVLANLRTRKQLERLIRFIILTSIPVTMYGLLQANRLDPLPWAGDTATRVASTMGNAIFVAAWVIIAVPFTLYRFLGGISSIFAAVNRDLETANQTIIDAEADKQRAPRRTRAPEGPDYSWAVVANVFGLLLISLMLFMTVLKMVAGLPFPDAKLWPALPFAIIVFYGSCWAIEWLNNHRYDPAQVKVYMSIIGVVLSILSFTAFLPTWTLVPQDLSVKVDLDGGAFLWVLFVVMLWAAVSSIAYFFGAQPTPITTRNPDRGIIPASRNVGYGVLLLIQLTCIYLTQSRGPWLGIGVGLVAFAVCLLFVGLRQNVRWMTLTGGVASGIVLLVAIFIGLLNIDGSPLQALDKMPVFGTGIARLSTLTRTEDGTGKVRTLIWLGATQLIVSDPVRTIIGYGPEAMYVVYNQFYPPELAHWELRNATPDRSHNVEFDHLVTMGVMGLLAYYFMLAAYFFYAIKLLKRTTNTSDQLFIIALIAAMTAHFVEIQTGIQIAATWTYFYLMIGMLVAFGYYITGDLREKAVATSAQPLPAAATVGLPELATGAASVAEAARQAVATGTASARQAQANTVAVSAGGNGKSSTTSTTAAQKPKAKSAQQGREGGSALRNGGTSSDARRRQAQMQTRVSRPLASAPFSNNPVLAILYGAALLGALLIIWFVNVATVQADTFYKQGQSFDSAQRWHDSVDRYQAAIEKQPNQDYYYLFLGRAYLEMAKITQDEMTGNDRSTGQPILDPRTGKAFTPDVIQTERTARLLKAEEYLKRARDLNPLNTDHYANLGRLYLYWSDPTATGGQDPSKAALSVQNMEEAVNRSPGNAQLWDELAVSYSRINQFDQALQTLEHSLRDVDTTFARTPFIKGQLLEERANNVKTALGNGDPLPTGGETDYGALVVQAGLAFSESIKLDPAFFVDNGMQNRVDTFLNASQSFPNNNTKDRVALHDVLTNTLMAAYQIQVPVIEAQVADALRARGGYKGEANLVPSTTLEALWNDPAWAGDKPGGGNTKEWLDVDFEAVARQALVPYAALGYTYFKLGDQNTAVVLYRRAVALDPSNYFNQKNLGSLLIEQQHYDEALSHLQTAYDIIQNDPTLSQDSQKQSELTGVQQEIQRAQSLKGPTP